jgi:hypothetical protein
MAALGKSGKRHWTRIPTLLTLGFPQDQDFSNRFVQDQISPTPASWTASPGPLLLNKKTSVHDRRFLPSTAALPDLPIKPHIDPLCCCERLSQGRFAEQKDYCTRPVAHALNGGLSLTPGSTS